MSRAKFFKKLAVLTSLLLCVTSTACTLFKAPCVECVDEDNDHLCDVCHEKISGCIDFDENHLCDTCGVATSTCLDTDNDHLCDVCGGRISDCKDTDNNHACDTCISVISGCGDEDGDHLCDVCRTRLSECADGDTDGVCDTCGGSVAQPTPTMYEVKLYEDGALKRTLSVKEGTKLPMQSATNKQFYNFIGWKTDGVNGSFYDFNRAVESNLSLYAYYEVDYVAFTNELTSQYMDGMVTVHTQFTWTDNRTYTSKGSGVIYAQEGNYFYLVTNNHVVYEYYTSKAAGRYGTLTVDDCYDNEYTGSLLGYDKEYDLAIIRFAKNANNKYQPEPYDFAAANPSIGQEIVAIGSPHGQSNAITYGKVLGMKTGCAINDVSSIDFACIKHDAWLTNGSSGGILMDLSFNIVGINFAVQMDLSGENFLYALAIPMQKVREFLASNNQLHGV